MIEMRGIYNGYKVESIKNSPRRIRGPGWNIVRIMLEKIIN